MRHTLYEQYKEELIQGYLRDPELVQSTLLQTLDVLRERLSDGRILMPEFLRQVMNCTRENLQAVEEASKRRLANSQH